MSSLTVIIPVYNEAKTILAVLRRAAAVDCAKTIIVVDDGSTDGTVEVLKLAQQEYGELVQLFFHPCNRGKGSAIRTGLAAATGTFVLVQDADLEYFPEDYPKLLAPLLAGKTQAVFGSRYAGRGNHLPWTPNRLCVHLLNLMVRLLYFQRISDEATCYKVIARDLLLAMNLQCSRFEFCPEVTAKLCRLGTNIVEVPIRYEPRSAREGKKIRWWDGVEAIWTLLYWRFAPLRPPLQSPRGPASILPRGKLTLPVVD